MFKLKKCLLTFKDEYNNNNDNKNHLTIDKIERICIKITVHSEQGIENNKKWKNNASNEM